MMLATALPAQVEASLISVAVVSVLRCVSQLCYRFLEETKDTDRVERDSKRKKTVLLLTWLWNVTSTWNKHVFALAAAFHCTLCMACGVQVLSSHCSTAPGLQLEDVNISQQE